MKWTEAAIARAICRQTLQRRCVVLVDRCNWTGHEADVLGVTMDGRLIDVEIKVSRADLRADARKDKWWRHIGWRPVNVPTPTGRRLAEPIRERAEWPRRVWKHYYCLPRELWDDALLDALPSPASGVLLITEGSHGPVISCRRRATPCRDADRLRPEQILDVARLANLRMWDAYERAERAEHEQRPEAA